MKPSFRLGAVALVAACWLSAGSRPFADALTGLADPADLARDYVTARARLEEGRGPSPDGEDANVRAVRYGAPQVALYGAPYYVHPPTATLAVLPLGRLPFRAAALVWAAGSVVALGWLALSLLGIWKPETPPKPTHVALLMLGLAAWPPSLYCLEKGQWSIWVAALLAAGLRAFEAKRPRGAGALFGLAAALKVTPAVLIGFLLARSRRAAAAMLAVIGAAAIASLAVLGPAPWRQLFAGSASNAAIWAPWLANTASVDGIFARLLTSNPFARPLVAAPALARAAFALMSLALLAAAIATTFRRRGAPGSQARLLGGWLTLPVLLNPLGWSHVVLLLLAPLAVLAREGGARAGLAAVLLLAAMSIPRQRLIEWAGAVPVGPAGSLLLGLHALAALALFGMLLGERSAAERPVGEIAR